MRTLLQIVQAACDEMGLPRPTAVVGSNDAQAVQMLALANREGKELASRENGNGGWSVLASGHVVTLVASQAGYSFPTDLQYFTNTTAWDRDNKWPLHGPVSPQVWQVLKWGTVGSIGPRKRFRIYQGDIFIDPTPTASEAGQTMYFEYYSNGWVTTPAVTYRDSWSTDGDTTRLPDDLFVLGLMWRYKRAKGLDYAEEFKTYEDAVQRELARDAMAPILNLDGPRPSTRLLDDSNLPDSGFGV